MTGRTGSSTLHLKVDDDLYSGGFGNQGTTVTANFYDMPQPEDTEANIYDMPQPQDSVAVNYAAASDTLRSQTSQASRYTNRPVYATDAHIQSATSSRA